MYGDNGGNLQGFTRLAGRKLVAVGGQGGGFSSAVPPLGPACIRHPQARPGVGHLVPPLPPHYSGFFHAASRGVVSLVVCWRVSPDRC